MAFAEGNKNAARNFEFGYLDLTKIADATYGSVLQHVSRGELDPDSIESVILWAAKYGREDLRIQMVGRLVRLDLKKKNRERGEKVRKGVKGPRSGEIKKKR
jgi:hypothetical protein